MVVRTASESLSARLRSRVQQSANDSHWASTSGGTFAPASLSSSNVGAVADPAAAPVQHGSKPLLYFYKYLQPVVESGRRLQLNVPTTVTCERVDGQEDVLWLRTDALGFVVKDERGIGGGPWRKRLHADLVASSDTAESGHDDPVIAVHNVAHWRGGDSNNKSLVLTRATLETVISAPTELAFSVQQFVRCRGSHASIYRVHWSDVERKCFALNLVNTVPKTSDVPQDGSSDDHADASSSTSTSPSSSSRELLRLPDKSALELALASLTHRSQFYCVSATTRDRKTCERLPKIRGSPIIEGVRAVTRMVEHVQAQLPGIRIPALAADFIKDAHGTWWFIRVMALDAYYRVPVPPDALYLPESVTQIPEAMRSKHMRQLVQLGTGAHASATGHADKQQQQPLTATIPECVLCGACCALSPTFSRELLALVRESDSADDSHGGVLQALAEYRMTLKMAVDTIYLLRQRAVRVPSWEAAVASLRKAPSAVHAATDFAVCFLCYRIYKQQQKLRAVALELHSVFTSAGSGTDALQSENLSTPASIFDSPAVSKTAATTRAALDAIAQLAREPWPSFPEGTTSSASSSSASTSSTLAAAGFAGDERSARASSYTIVTGADVDPTSTQLRLAFFFHELQDAGPDLVPTDFYLEYQLGQVATQLHLEGSKCHTPNRWQLCETRLHYVCATLDAFADYCLEKRVVITLKARASGAVHGVTALSLRPLMAVAKRFGTSLLPASRTDYLVEIRTDLYGLLTLKLTLGLLVDSVPFAHVREVLGPREFLKEEPLSVYWPPPSVCYTGLAVPCDWVGALMPSEYISVVPMRSHMASHHSRGHRSGGVQGGDSIGGRSAGANLAMMLHASRSGSSANDASGGSKPRTAARRSSVTSARDSLLQFQRDIGASHAALSGVPAAAASALNELPNSRASLLRRRGAGGAARSGGPDHSASRRPILSGKLLTIAVTAAKRMVFRIAGDVAVCPTLVLAVLLRSANYVGPRDPNSSSGSSTSITARAWRSAATFALTRKYSIDAVLTDLKLVNVPALAVLGELLVVLLKCRAIPQSVELRSLEALVEPFWLHESDTSGWRTVAKTSAHSPEQRTDDNDSDLRVKAHALVLCEVFEEMEVLDNGYIDIAEVRSLAKCLPADLATHVRVPALLDPLHVRERLSPDELTSLADVLDVQQFAAFGAVLTSLMQSPIVCDVLAEFDRVGCGEIAFGEFWHLAESALRAARSIFSPLEGEEPRMRGFCMRHGTVDAFAIDGVCAQCASEYIGVPRAQPAAVAEPITSLKEISDADATPATGDSDASATPSIAPKRKFGMVRREVSGRFIIDMATALVASSPLEDAKNASNGSGSAQIQPSTLAPGLPSTASVSPPSASLRQPSIGEGSLNQMLEKLEAAEWHILHRQESIGRASLSDLIAQSSRRGSGFSTTRRSSSTSTSAPSIASNGAAAPSNRALAKSSTIATLAEFVEDAERRKRTSVKLLTRPKRSSHKPKHKRPDSAAAATTTASTISLSALLRDELRIATRARAAAAAAVAAETTTATTRHEAHGLVERIAKSEAKRKKLDRIVLAEIEDVKRRLAKLMQTECG